MKKIKNITFIKRAAVCVFIAVAGIVSLVTFSGGNPPESEFAVTKESLGAESFSSGEETGSFGSMVYVCGAVKSPGVYECTEGMRVADAIKLAGGANENADLASLNLAEFVEDASKIEVYELAAAGQAGDGSKEGEASDGDGLININKADKDALMTLAGVGESKALAIIDYRKTNGSFKKIEDIMNVSGIKEAGFNKIKDKIRV